MSRKKKKFRKLDEGYYHEALDRSYIVANMVDEYLFEHPVIKKHKELKKRIKKARKLLLESYQLIGGLEFKKFPDPAQQADKK